MFNRYIEGLRKIGITKANKNRRNINTDADIARNFRSSNTNYTFDT